MNAVPPKVVAGAFGVWLLGWICIVLLLLVLTVMVLRDMAVKARSKRREKARIAEQVRDFRRELQEWRP